jgi:hypothetical protein
VALVNDRHRRALHLQSSNPDVRRHLGLSVTPPRAGCRAPGPRVLLAALISMAMRRPSPSWRCIAPGDTSSPRVSGPSAPTTSALSRARRLRGDGSRQPSAARSSIEHGRHHHDITSFAAENNPQKKIAALRDAPPRTGQRRVVRVGFAVFGWLITPQPMLLRWRAASSAAVHGS